MKYLYASIALLSLISLIYMDETLIRKIAREEAQKLFDGNFDSGNVGPHQHDDADNVRISQKNLKEFIPLPSYLKPAGQGILHFNQTLTGDGNLQFPIVYGTIGSNTFQGGTAQNGTMVVEFTSQHSAYLYFYLVGQDQTTSATLTGSLLAGATSATLNANWSYPTADHVTYFSNGDIRTVTYTNGSAAISWTGGLSGTATSAITLVFSGKGTWWGVNLPLSIVSP